MVYGGSIPPCALRKQPTKHNMQKFGIEIRKIGNITNLYKDVDVVLGKYGMTSQTVSDEAKISTVAHSLQKMLQADKWFDVCTIDSCAKVCQICIPKERQNIYRAAHCVHWSEMLPDYRQMLVAMVLDDFRTVLCP
jgi:hypothetical protein